MGDTRVALGEIEELILGDQHDRTGLAGDHAGTAFFAGEYRHGPENLILGHITDLVSVDEGFGMPFGDDEDMIGIIALADQYVARRDLLEAVAAAEFRLFEAGDGIRSDSRAVWPTR